MTNRIPLLTGLLVVQLLLVGIVMFRDGGDRAASALLDFDESAVTSLSIEDGDGNTVTLERTDEGWRLGEVPADSNKINDVIGSLTGGSVSWPVATSESSQARFEVTADAFQRRVNFGGISGELAVLYIGSSPGFRRVHARRDGDDAVYSIDFGVHELPADRSEWLNKQLFRTEGISRVVLPQGEVLMMDDQGLWTLDGRATDAAVTGEYVDRIARLAVLGFADDAALDDLGDPQVLSVVDEQGSHALTFRFDEAEDQYVLTSDRMPGEYTVASYIVEQVLISADELEEVEPSEEMSFEEEASSTEGG